MQFQLFDSLNNARKSLLFLAMAAFILQLSTPSYSDIRNDAELGKYFSNFKPKYHRKDCLVGLEYRDLETGERWPPLFAASTILPFLKKNEPKASVYSGGSGHQAKPGWQRYYFQFADQCLRKHEIVKKIANYLIKNNNHEVEINILSGPFIPGKGTIDVYSKDLWLPDE